MPDKVGIDETMRDVTGRLEEMKRQLEALSMAIWENIDHDDTAGLEAGVRFKQRYNERRSTLEKTLGEMLALLREYPRPGPDKGELPETAVKPEEAVPSPTPVAPGDATKPVSGPLLANLDQKVPFGFVLGGQTFTSASAWPLFYEALLQEFYGRAPEKLSRLAEEPGAFTQNGRPLFARVPDRLDDPLPIADAIFAEADLHPEVLLEVIRRLISEMGYSLDTFKILLKEKNRGTVETLSIAA